MLGWIVKQDKLQPNTEAISKIIKFEPITSVSKLRLFICSCLFIAETVSELIFPISVLTDALKRENKSKAKFILTEKDSKNIEECKQLCAKAHAIEIFDTNKCARIFTDAYDLAYGEKKFTSNEQKWH